MPTLTCQEHADPAFLLMGVLKHKWGMPSPPCFSSSW